MSEKETPTDDYDELIAAIAEMPEDSMMQVLGTALVEVRDGELMKASVKGIAASSELWEVSRWATMGFMDGRVKPQVMLQPGPKELEDERAYRELVTMLIGERPRQPDPEKLRAIRETTTLTLVHLADGAIRGTGERVVALWHHPSLTIRESAWLAMAAIVQFLDPPGTTRPS